MRICEIKGVAIGVGRPKTVVSLMCDKDSSMFAQDLVRVTGGGVLGTPDCIEWRADYSRDLTPDAVAGTCFYLSEELLRQPLIATCRTVEQGGEASLSAAAYADLCLALIERGATDIVDIELTAGVSACAELVAASREAGVHALLSYHDFQKTPDAGFISQTLLTMADLGADICKIAVMAHTDADSERLMQAVGCAHNELERIGADRPLCGIAMGEAGRRTRLEGERFGSALTFCAMGRASAPGQVDLVEATRVLDEVHCMISAG